MQPLPALVYPTAAVRAAARYAIEVLGIPGYGLMTRAGGGAGRAAAGWPAARGAVLPFAAALLEHADLVVDALLGPGLTRAVGLPLSEVIAALDVNAWPLVALDVPSGLPSDTGEVRGIAVRAALTVTFVGLKPGLFLGSGPEHVGRLICDDLDVPPAAFASAAPALPRILQTHPPAAL